MDGAARRAALAILWIEHFHCMEMRSVIQGGRPWWFTGAAGIEGEPDRVGMERDALAEVVAAAPGSCTRMWDGWIRLR
jgi:hypothetical protein